LTQPSRLHVYARDFDSTPRSPTAQSVVYFSLDSRWALRTSTGGSRGIPSLEGE